MPCSLLDYLEEAEKQGKRRKPQIRKDEERREKKDGEVYKHRL
jgi:hypothetical protein